MTHMTRTYVHDMPPDDVSVFTLHDHAAALQAGPITFILEDLGEAETLGHRIVHEARRARAEAAQAAAPFVGGAL